MTGHFQMLLRIGGEGARSRGGMDCSGCGTSGRDGSRWVIRKSKRMKYILYELCLLRRLSEGSFGLLLLVEQMQRAVLKIERRQGCCCCWIGNRRR